MLTPAVFFDRDDTLIACREVTVDGDLGDPGLVALLPGALEACRRLKEAGFALVVVSNQGGVARGRFTEEAVAAVNERVNQLLGGRIDAFRHCPFHPQGSVPRYTCEHPWRKPGPGMILDAAETLSLDLDRSWLIGDAERDCAAGRAAGLGGRTILLTQAKGGAAGEYDPPRRSDSVADFVAAGLGEAVEIVLRGRGGAP